MTTATKQEDRAEAIANADAHANDAGLPTYTELLAALQEAQKWAAQGCPAACMNAVQRVRIAA
jgi:hypothetical protein